ncbi:hypothetical protein DPEC_G00364110 [Dallia pectoralis]|nr:hypothetical protein DPEC_G00364110 [Dallia pectoralis]
MSEHACVTVGLLAISCLAVRVTLIGVCPPQHTRPQRALWDYRKSQPPRPAVPVGCLPARSKTWRPSIDSRPTRQPTVPSRSSACNMKVDERQCWRVFPETNISGCVPCEMQAASLGILCSSHPGCGAWL